MAGLLSATASVDAVSAELRRWAREPFDEVTRNCALSVLSYVEGISGRHLPLGARLFTRRRQRELLRAHGGLRGLSRWALPQLGCVETGVPVRGDVGLVELPGGLTAAICLGDQWAVRGDRAAIIMPATAAIAWRVPCPKR